MENSNEQNTAVTAPSQMAASGATESPLEFDDIVKSAVGLRAMLYSEEVKVVDYQSPCIVRTLAETNKNVYRSKGEIVYNKYHVLNLIEDRSDIYDSFEEGHLKVEKSRTTYQDYSNSERERITVLLDDGTTLTQNSDFAFLAYVSNELEMFYEVYHVELDSEDLEELDNIDYLDTRGFEFAGFIASGNQIY